MKCFPLIDCSPQQLYPLASECGFADDFGQLCTPLTNYRIHPTAKFALDNGGFSRALPQKYRNLMNKARPYQNRCIWATVPDIPGDARRTMELFWHWRPFMEGYRIALVAQDGLENMSIPWDQIHCVFIGGTTEWKLSVYAENIIRTAQWMEKWVHVGRINTGNRWEKFASLGVNSFDGSALARPYPGARQQRQGISESRAKILSKESPAQDAATTGSEVAVNVSTADWL